jgi:hypothetical protein
MGPVERPMTLGCRAAPSASTSRASTVCALPIRINRNGSRQVTTLWVSARWTMVGRHPSEQIAMSDEAQSEFLAAHAAHEAGKEEARLAHVALRHVYEAELRARYKTETGKRWSSDKASKEPWFKAFQDEWTEKARGINSAQEAKEEVEIVRLSELAAGIPLPVSNTEVEIGRSSGWGWMSQGYGANAYARNDAERKADKARLHGLEVTVVTIEKEETDRSVETYGVFAQTTEVGKLLLQFREEPDLRSEVAMMWKRGANPRVYMPFLPHGYEASVGLDMFGNDLPVKVQTPRP